jgi:hypothetical protein
VFILGEALIGAFWSGLSRWGPAAVSSTLAAGSTGGGAMFGRTAPTVSDVTVTLLAIGYNLLALALTATVLTRRDVRPSRPRHLAMSDTTPTRRDRP